MVLHRTVTLSGSAQNLGTALAATPVKGTIKFLSIQSDPANDAVVYVGGSESTLTTSDYGQIIPIPVTNIPAAPTIIELPAGYYGLADIQVLGGNTKKIHLMIVTS